MMSKLPPLSPRKMARRRDPIGIAWVFAQGNTLTRLHKPLKEHEAQAAENSCEQEATTTRHNAIFYTEKCVYKKQFYQGCNLKYVYQKLQFTVPHHGGFIRKTAFLSTLSPYPSFDEVRSIKKFHVRRLGYIG